MRIAFLGVRVPGHLNPMTTLARDLKARAEAFVLDQLDTGLGLVPMHLGMPYVRRNRSHTRLDHQFKYLIFTLRNS